MSDLISRQAAIDAIHEDADWLAAQGSDWQVERMERDKSILKSLPSAQPEGRSGVFIPDITVKNLREAPLEAVEELLVLGEMEDIVLPSAQPEIIRCKDCKHHDGSRCFRWNSTIITGFDDYCSKAELRGEQDEAE